MKKKTKIIIVVVVVILLVIGICGNQPQKNSEKTTTAQQEQNDVTEETTQQEEVNDYEVIDVFIEKYNSITDNKITNIREMDIQGDDYRTEFRLNAFKNAIGKKGKLVDGNINIVNYGVWSNDAVRIYVNAKSLDKVIKIYTRIIHILDDSISDEDIKDSYSSLDTVDSANIYLGSSGHISGYINVTYANGGVSGYEVMIDCDDINYVDQ